MKINLDKLKNLLMINKKMMFFLVLLSIIAVIFGSFYVTILKLEDQTLVKESIQMYVENIDKVKLLDNFLNIFLSNFTYAIIIWLLGISIIGIPIIMIMFFSKCFILGFGVGSIFLNYKAKGILFAITYIFPHSIINILIFAFLIIYSCALSIKIIDSILKKSSIDFKPIINKYLRILIIVLVGILLTSLFETFITPNLIKTVIPIIK